MKLVWTRPALVDLIRLHAFLEPVNPRAADAAVKALHGGARQLLDFPRLGRGLEQYAPRDVRLIIGGYELRYELAGEMIYVLRLWHGREDR